MNKLEPNEVYYVQTTLLNGAIDVNISSRGKKALSKELWESLNESERKEIKYNPEVKHLDVTSLTAKTQEAIRGLIQANITEAVQYVYTCTKERKGRDIREIVEKIASTLAKGIIKK